MKISELSIAPLEIPFNVAFNHASASRAKTDSVIVTAKSEANIAYGEACPRAYVTGETVESVMAFFQQYKADLIQSVTSLASLQDWVCQHHIEIDKNPAAWCAIELALLELLAKENAASVEHLLGLPELKDGFSYTAVLGDSSIEGFLQLLARYQAMGFDDFKVKLSGVLEHDRQKSNAVRAVNKDARLRLDANNLWQTSEEVVEYISQLACKPFALEEPLQANDYSGLAEVAKRLDTKIILDESFLRREQFRFLQDSPQQWLINIRISKMGGLIRAIDIAEQAKQSGIHCVVGAQVGETSILTRAALCLVNSYRDVVIAQEGACGTYLLKTDICQPVLMFGKGGIINQDQLNQLRPSGFGLTVSLPE